MARLLKQVGIADDFPRIHHFASPKFRTKSKYLVWFVEYCEGKDLGEENLQTIERAAAVAAAVQRGSSLEQALSKAWSDYPLKTR